MVEKYYAISLIFILVVALLFGTFRFFSRSKIEKNTWTLEGVMPEGHVVERTKDGRRRVLKVSETEPVKMFLFTEDEWRNGGSGTEITDGEI